MSTVVKDLGAVSAYAYAVEKGYTGTEAEFAELMADYAEVGQRAEDAADSALESKTAAQTAATTATNKATEATTAATTATTKAGEASTSASTATSAKDTAVSASQTATTKATEATTAAATATSAKTDAVAANTAAQSAKTAAQTAQTGAETAAASVEASAEQIATNAEDISQLKSEFTALESDGIVPSSEQILTDKGVTDSVPYHHRKTGGDGADRLYDQIVGGTVCWNQLVRNGNFADKSDWAPAVQIKSWEVGNGKATIVCNSSTDNTSLGQSGHAFKSGHKYFYHCDYEKSSTSSTIYGLFISNPSGIYKRFDVPQTKGTINLVYGCENNVTGDFRTGMKDSAPTGEWTYTISNVMFIDLTQMFGSTVADYIYQLEQTTAGEGVAFFKSLFPNTYYPYNAGELVSVSGLSEHKTVGFNQWDGTYEVGKWIADYTTGQVASQATYNVTDYIPVLPNTEYYKRDSGTSRTIFYDSAKNAIPMTSWEIGSNHTTFMSPSNAAYIRFSITDACLATFWFNFSDPAKNGIYEPYKGRSYPLDSGLTLRGLFKLDANNNLYADGDTYEYTGKVTRNTILRAYQSGDESLANAITDGTNTVVYSANASTEQAQPYQHLQQCDPSGTEEYVSTGIVPIGHNSFYPENLRAKVEQLPWNFANLIAPTESAFVATRNYTTGELFIVSNVLYKATSNIANGGTITPNTNCTATTLAEIISALA